MKQSIFFLILFIITTIGYGQERDSLIDNTKLLIKDSKEEEDLPFDNLPIIIGPSPSVSIFSGNSNALVDLYTGKLNVTIPIHTIKSKDIEIPVNLSYVSNGIKVDDVASWVGMGWILEAGGNVSRVMNGLPDEFSGEIHLMDRPINKNNDAYGYLYLKDINVKDDLILENFYGFSENDKKDIIQRADWQSIVHDEDVWDTQPDEFYFNFGNYSGKFVFNQDGTFELIPKQPIKIDKVISNGKLVKFIITTDNGYKYTFGDSNFNAVEKTSFIKEKISDTYRYNKVEEYRGTYYDPKTGTYIQNYLLNKEFMSKFENGKYYNYYEYTPEFHSSVSREFHLPEYTSAWHLKQIDSPSGDKVYFFYSNPENVLNYTVSKDETISMPNFQKVTYMNDCGFVWKDESPSEQEFTEQVISIHQTKIYHDIRKISKIETSTGNTLEFVLGENREDLLNDKSLKKITISEGNEKKYFNFVYDYMEPSKMNPEVDRSDQVRLRLKAVFETSSDFSMSVPPYQFEYYEGVLPARFSAQQDYAGYFNKNQSPSKIPPIRFDSWIGSTVLEPSSPCDNPFNLGCDCTIRGNGVYFGADLSPSFERTKIGMLKGIIYPTGGYKKFIYSSASPGLKVEEIDNNPMNGKSYKQIYSYSNSARLRENKFSYSVFEPSDFDHFDLFTSNNLFSPVLTKGSYVGYGEVSVSIPGIGETKYHFINPNTRIEDYSYANSRTTIYDVNADLYFTDQHPFPPDFDKDWQRGLVSSIEVFDENGGKIKETIYEYNLPPNGNSDFVYGLTAARYINAYDEDNDPYTFPHYWYRAGLYRYESNFLCKTHEKTYEYDPAFPGDESKAIETYNQYNYDPYNLQIKSISSQLSDGTILSTHYEYPQDVIEYAKNIDTLLNNKSIKSENPFDGVFYQVVNHIKNKPIQTSQRMNGEIISSRLDLFVVDDNVLLPYKTYTLKLDQPLNHGYFQYPNADFNSQTLTWDPRYGLPDITYDHFDSFGRIKQYSDENNIKYSYIWDLLNTPPIAKASNAGSNEIFYESFEKYDANDELPGDDPYWDYRLGYFKDDQKLTGNMSFSGYMILKSEFKNQLDPLKDYTLSYYKKAGISGKWELFTNTFRPSDNVYIMCASTSTYWVDEVRIHPSEALMTTYTFEPLMGMTSENNSDNTITKYLYDKLYRLETVKDKNDNILKHYEYKYSAYVPFPIGQIQGNSEVLIQQIETYSIPLVFGAEEYHWSIENGTIISQNMNQITVKFQGSGSIHVYATSDDWTDNTNTANLNVNAHFQTTVEGCDNIYTLNYPQWSSCDYYVSCLGSTDVEYYITDMNGNDITNIQNDWLEHFRYDYMILINCQKPPFGQTITLHVRAGKNGIWSEYATKSTNVLR
jgi:hypothetical protein